MLPVPPLWREIGWIIGRPSPVLSLSLSGRGTGDRVDRVDESDGERLGGRKGLPSRGLFKEGTAGPLGKEERRTTRCLFLQGRRGRGFGNAPFLFVAKMAPSRSSSDPHTTTPWKEDRTTRTGFPLQGEEGTVWESRAAWDSLSFFLFSGKDGLSDYRFPFSFLFFSFDSPLLIGGSSKILLGRTPSTSPHRADARTHRRRSIDEKGYRERKQPGVPRSSERGRSILTVPRAELSEASMHENRNEPHLASSLQKGVSQRTKGRVGRVIRDLSFGFPPPLMRSGSAE